ncbi:MAG: DEAD/DEAH box helicase [Desertimonas sp.]
MVVESSFRALGVPAALCTELDALGIAAPFEIQSAVIPPALAGTDVVGRAPTGSGKSLAFSVPLAAAVKPGRPRRPGGLVLAPTRELAEQLATTIRPLLRTRGLDVAAVYGGVGYGPQRRALDAGASVVVACPGRLEDLLSSDAIRLDDVRHVVIDEADRLADMGFLPAVRRILARVSERRQVLMFSATLDGAVGDASRSLQRNPVRVEVGEVGPDLSAARHAFWTVDRPDRARWTASVAAELGSTMVFCRTRHGADRLARQLAKFGVSAAPIHGGRSQRQRDRALRAFATNEVSALVATDVAARGVHVDHVAAVVHYDAPADAATFVHRSGRTARAGATGSVVTMVETGGERDARKLQREVGIDVAFRAPSIDALNPRPAASSKPAPTPATPATSVSQPVEQTDGRQVGVVKTFRRSYGFVDIGTGTDVFIHAKNVTGSVAAGDRVTFTLRPGRRGPRGVDVRTVAAAR